MQDDTHHAIVTLVRTMNDLSTRLAAQRLLIQALTTECAARSGDALAFTDNLRRRLDAPFPQEVRDQLDQMLAQIDAPAPPPE